MTNSSIGTVGIESKTSDDVLWGICYKLISLVDDKLMRMRLKDPGELDVEIFAEEIYASYGADPDLRGLLQELQGGHSSLYEEAVYLSGIRESLRQIVRASLVYPHMAVPLRIDAYRARPVE